MFYRHLRPTFLFDADSGGAGGGGATTPPAPAPSNNGNATGEETRTFKQSELNTMFAETRRQARASAVSDLLEPFGLKNTDDLKAAIEKLKWIPDLEKKIAGLETERDTVKAQAHDKLLRAAVMTTAAAQNVDAAQIGLVWLGLKDDKTLLESIKENDKGEFDGVEDAVKKIVEQHKIKLTTGGKPPTPGTPPAISDTKPPSDPNGNQEAVKKVNREYRSRF